MVEEGQEMALAQAPIGGALKIDLRNFRVPFVNVFRKKKKKKKNSESANFFKFSKFYFVLPGKFLEIVLYGLRTLMEYCI